MCVEPLVPFENMRIACGCLVGGANIAGDSDSWDFGVGAGFYVNATVDKWRKHYNMYDYIVKELPALVRQSFPVSEKQSGTYNREVLPLLYRTPPVLIRCWYVMDVSSNGPFYGRSWCADCIPEEPGHVPGDAMFHRAVEQSDGFRVLNLIDHTCP